MASIPEQSVPSVMMECVEEGMSGRSGAVGLAGSPTKARRLFCCVGSTARFFLVGAGLMVKLGLWGSVVWRSVLVISVAVMRDARRLVAFGVREIVGVLVVGW